MNNEVQSYIFLIEFKTVFIAFLRIIDLQLLYCLVLLQQTNEFFLSNIIYTTIEPFNIFHQVAQEMILATNF